MSAVKDDVVRALLHRLPRWAISELRHDDGTLSNGTGLPRERNASIFLLLLRYSFITASSLNAFSTERQLTQTTLASYCLTGLLSIALH